MILFGFGRMFVVLVAERQLESIVPVRLFGLYLGYHAGARLNDRAGCLFARGIEDTGHPDFLPNNTFHECSICACRIIGTFFVAAVTISVTPSKAKGQSPFAADLFLHGEVPAVNKP
jgi:hypothetical protein